MSGDNGGWHLVRGAFYPLRKVAVDFPLEIEEVDITSDAEAWRKYRECIPVIAINGRTVFRGKVTELWLRRELRKVGV